MSEHAIYVINLTRSPHRREAMNAQLEGLGLVYEFFAAVDGQSLDVEKCEAYDGPRRRARFGYDLHPNEIGCYLSHLGCVEKAWARGLDRITVMEDDIRLGSDFSEVYEACLSLPEDIEMVRFIGTRERAFVGQKQLVGKYQLVRPTHGMLGAQAYMLNRAGMKKLIDYGQRIMMQYDIMVDRFYENRLRIFSVRPYPVAADEHDQSDIGVYSDRWREDRNRLLRWRLKVGKLRDGIKRRWFVARTF
ncbi:MAG: glycosyltransferase family 25 protein [Alphaproteobacteria bacterium]